MAQTYDLLLKGGTVVNQDGRALRDVGVRGGRIVAIGALEEAAAGEIINVKGLHVLPGVIDTQVHFREPGPTHKEDLESGSRAAVMGGVTGVFEMPNTNPSTTDAAALLDKLERAKDRMWCDHAFYAGASAENVDDLPELERISGCCGVKVFMGSSTGSLLVDDDATLARVLQKITRRAAFHCEDEARLIARENERVSGDPSSHPVWRDELTAFTATKRLVNLARKARKPVHVLHVTTGREMDFLAQNKDIATLEATPQHLTLAAPDAYSELGTLAQMNPPIRGEKERAALMRAVQAGIVDVIGSDHAPHTREEKARAYPQSPSGMPGVQTLVPVMLDHVNRGRLTLERFVDLSSHGAHRIFGIAGKGRIAVGYDADFTIVDMQARRTMNDSWSQSRCGWTPFHGRVLQGWPVGTIIRGRPVMWEGELQGQATGQPMRFWSAL
jgi:dihydroorotase